MEHPALLTGNEALWFEKFCLICMIEMTFRREATARQIYTEIANATTPPVDQVVMLIMKGFNQGLVKSRIDEVDTQSGLML